MKKTRTSYYYVLLGTDWVTVGLNKGQVVAGKATWSTNGGWSVGKHAESIFHGVQIKDVGRQADGW